MEHAVWGTLRVYRDLRYPWEGRSTAKNYVAIAIDAVNLKNRLREIETNRRGRLHDLVPPNHWVPKHPSLHGTLVPRVEEPSAASLSDVRHRWMVYRSLAKGAS